MHIYYLSYPILRNICTIVYVFTYFCKALNFTLLDVVLSLGTTTHSYILSFSLRDLLALKKSSKLANFHKHLNQRLPLLNVSFNASRGPVADAAPGSSARRARGRRMSAPGRARSRSPRGRAGSRSAPKSWQFLQKSKDFDRGDVEIARYCVISIDSHKF